MEYAPIDMDTTRVQHMVSIGNGKYPLRVFSYSRNDSSVVNVYGSQGSIEHDRAFRLVLEGHDGGDQSITLDRQTFRDSLNTDFYERACLYLVDYVAVRSNALYFEAYVGVPESDNVQRFRLQWFFRGPRTGSMRFHSIPETEPF